MIINTKHTKQSLSNLISGLKTDSFHDGGNKIYTIDDCLIIENSHNITIQNCIFFISPDINWTSRVAFGFFRCQNIKFHNCTFIGDINSQLLNLPDSNYKDSRNLINNLILGFFQCDGVDVTNCTFNIPAFTHVKYVATSNVYIARNYFYGKYSWHGIEGSCGDTGASRKINPSGEMSEEARWGPQSIWPNLCGMLGSLFKEVKFIGKGVAEHTIQFSSDSRDLEKTGLWKTNNHEPLANGTIEMTGRWKPIIVSESSTHVTLSAEGVFQNGVEYQVFFHNPSYEIHNIVIEDNYFGNYYICGSSMYYASGWRFEGNIMHNILFDYFGGSEISRKGIIKNNIGLSYPNSIDNQNPGCRYGLLGRISDIVISGNSLPVDLNAKNSPIFNIVTDQRVDNAGFSKWQTPTTILNTDVARS